MRGRHQGGSLITHGRGEESPKAAVLYFQAKYLTYWKSMKLMHAWEIPYLLEYESKRVRVRVCKCVLVLACASVPDSDMSSQKHLHHTVLPPELLANLCKYAR